MLRQRGWPLLLLLLLAWQLLLQESCHQLVSMQLACCRTVAAVCHTATAHADSSAAAAAEVSAGECAGVVKVAVGVVAGAAVQGEQGLFPLQPAAPLAAYHSLDATFDLMLETLASMPAVMLTLQFVGIVLLLVAGCWLLVAGGTCTRPRVGKDVRRKTS
jgi:hypothetical protein